MLKDRNYHEAAVQYNEELAIFAEKLADKLKNDEIRRWCLSVAKQHRFHAGRHHRALNKMVEYDVQYKGSPHVPIEERHGQGESQKLTIAEEQAQFASRMSDDDDEDDSVEAGVGTHVDEAREDS